jgi:hypothetical protein
MELPNGDQAIVEPAKLRDYCLNHAHARGRHKARVFASRLDIRADNMERLMDALKTAAAELDAQLGEEDEYGSRFVVDFWMEGPRGSAQVRSGWIIKTGEHIPRLTTCFVL